MQNNGYDCGVFMICGIRDFINRRGKSWSFDQYDMKYKRYQIAA